MTTFKRMAIVAAAIVVCISTFTQSRGEAGFLYVIVDHQSPTLVRVQVIDPTNPTQIVKQWDFEYLPGMIGFTIDSISPDGRWMLHYTRYRNTGTPQLVEIFLRHTSTEETISIGVFPNLDTPSYSRISPVEASWSPDSRYIALLLGRTVNSWDSILYLYDTVSRTLTNLSQNGSNYAHPLWSPDGSQLAYAETNCTTGACKVMIGIRNVLTGQVRHSEALPDEIVNGAHPEITVCQLSWSPEGTHMLFRVNCGDPLFSYKELHLLSLSTGVISRLTEYTRLLSSPSDHSIYTVWYYPLWFDNTTILLGATKSLSLVGGDEIGSVWLTEAYDITNNANPLLFRDTYLQEWAKNPVTNQLAALRTRRINANVVYDTVLMTYNNGILSVNAVLPAGCNLSWDPEGRYLVYSQHTENRSCEKYIQNLTFYDSATGYSISTSYPIASVVGWIPRSAVMPPPTDLRALYAAYNSAPVTPVLHPSIVIRNHTNTPVPLSEVSLRYYFTRDGSADLQASCTFIPYYPSGVLPDIIPEPAPCSSSVIVETGALTAPTATADSYLELRFTGGTLAANGYTVQYILSVNKADWSNFQQTNDYSYSAFGMYPLPEWDKITLTRQGTAVWGAAPR